MKLSLLKKNKEMYSKKTHSSTTRENNKFSLANAFCYRRSNSGKTIAKHPKTFGSKDEEINTTNVRKQKKTKLPNINNSPSRIVTNNNNNNICKNKTTKISPLAATPASNKSSNEKFLLPMNPKRRFLTNPLSNVKKVQVDNCTTKIITPVTTSLNPLTGIFEISDCLAKSECENIIAKAEEYALRYGWTYDRHKFFPTVDIPTKSVATLRPISNTILNTLVFPQVRKQFGLHDATFTVADEFIVKYAVDGDDRSRDKLDAHRDGSLISYNILLNDSNDFNGGGTYFECINHTVTPKQGSMLLHCGKLRHSGRKITRGTRYILIGFLDVHSKALEDVRKDQKKDLQTDKAWLNTLWKPLRRFFVGDVVRCRGYHVQRGSVKGLSYTYEARVTKIRYGTNYVTIEYFPNREYSTFSGKCATTKVITADNILSVKSSRTRESLRSWK